MFDSHPLWLEEGVARVPGRQRTGVDDRLVLGRFGVGGVHHGDHGDAEVDAETVDDGQAEEHEEGEVEASGAALRRN